MRFLSISLRLLVATGCVTGLSAQSSGAVNRTANRITKRIDTRDRQLLSGHIHPKARAEYDQGRVPPSLALSYVTLAFSQTASQQAELEQLLAAQRDPASPNYQRWVTPEEYAARFGATEADVNAVTAWLQSAGLTIAEVARGRNWIAVNGSASQIENAFGMELHSYAVDGETHFANATEPSIPTAVTALVKNIRGLNDFRMKAGRVVSPKYTSTSGNHYLSPDDLSTIYDISPLYGAGIDGTGQKIVIAGQTQIDLSDVRQFRNRFSLPVNDPQIVLVPNTRDPGISSTDVPEANLDLQWSGAVARNATILYVYSSDVMVAVQYAINQNLAPVVSTSYGSCELETSAGEAFTLQSWAKQGNAQGITWVSASGDSGAADCNDSRNRGIAVDLPGSIPEVTSVGGTEFNEGTGQYWSATTGPTGASALSYIPETAWNDSLLDGAPSATGGGSSVLFARPTWQSGPGVPSDTVRHTPDVSFSASADHVAYLVYNGGRLQAYGGTSVPTPMFAGVVALLNQYSTASGALRQAGLGNINPKLYSLAQTTPSVFHDITTGDNIVTVACSRRSFNCVPTAVGYSAGAGYDQVTGLGSADIYRLTAAWNGSPTPVTPVTPVTNLTSTMDLVSNVATVGAGDTAFLIATVTSPTTATPTGTVTFSSGNTVLGSTALVGSGNIATATLEVTSAQLSQSSSVITGSYQGDGSSTAASSVTLNLKSMASSAGPMAITALRDGASFQEKYAPGMILSIFGSGLAISTELNSSVPLANATAGVAATVNGVAAPIYYVSPGQLNIQIPYETVEGSAILRINNNGQVVTRPFTVAATAPGIFTDSGNAPVPTAAAARGEMAVLYATGSGVMAPQVATGAAPSALTALTDLPKPTQAARLTIAGLEAPIQFIGDTVGLVGVIQINYQVPANAPTGLQAMVLSIGGNSSAPVQINVAK